MNKLIIVIHIQTGKDIGLRLDKWLLRRTKLPWTLINKLVRQGKFAAEGKKLDCSYKLKINDEIEFPLNFKITSPVVANSGLRSTFEKWVIYTDSDIIAINKPPGLATQGGTGVKLSIDALADEFFGGKLMHRIDRNVSGLLVIAKNTQACSIPILNKIYYAIVIGVPKDSGEITDKILNCGDRQKISSEGKEATTYFERIETVEVEGTNYSLLKIWINTGRKHQIRVHCASSLGAPVLGDGKYGGGEHDRIYLHAYSCNVNQNIITAPLTPCFLDMLKTLKFQTNI